MTRYCPACGGQGATWRGTKGRCSGCGVRFTIIRKWEGSDGQPMTTRYDWPGGSKSIQLVPGARRRGKRDKFTKGVAA